MSIADIFQWFSLKLNKTSKINFLRNCHLLYTHVCLSQSSTNRQAESLTFCNQSQVDFFRRYSKNLKLYVYMKFNWKEKVKVLIIAKNGWNGSTCIILLLQFFFDCWNIAPCEMWIKSNAFLHSVTKEKLKSIKF